MVHHHEKHPDSHQHLAKGAQVIGRGTRMGQPDHKREQGQDDENDERQADWGQDQVILAARDQPHPPHRIQRRKDQVEKGRRESDLEGQGGKGQQADHTQQRVQRPAHVAQHQQAPHTGDQYGDRSDGRQVGQQRADHQGNAGQHAGQRPVDPPLGGGQQERAQARDLTFTQQLVHLLLQKCRAPTAAAANDTTEIAPPK